MQKNKVRELLFEVMADEDEALHVLDLLKGHEEALPAMLLYAMFCLVNDACKVGRKRDLHEEAAD